MGVWKVGEEEGFPGQRSLPGGNQEILGEMDHDPKGHTKQIPICPFQPSNFLL